jgi:signal transduction histidine kinase
MAATTALASEPDQPRESRTELIKIADEEAKRLKEVIDDSLELARLDTADMHVQRELADAGEIVREVVAAMRSEIDQRPLEIVSHGHPGAIAVDQRLMKLAIKQLLDNALKYSPPDTPITIQVQNGAGTITVAVTDHGSGMSEQEQKRVFERLYRSPSVQHRIPGSGLGLSIALDIARAHHGDLSVASRPGETTFSLTLPVEHAPQPDGGWN